MDKQVKRELVETAELIIAGDLDLVRGCRKLTRLSQSFHDFDAPIFNPILGFESETDDYPLDGVRETYERAYLEKLDREIEEYSDRARPSVLEACKHIVTVYGELNPDGTARIWPG